MLFVSSRSSPYICIPLYFDFIVCRQQFSLIYMIKLMVNCLDLTSFSLFQPISKHDNYDCLLY